MKRITVSVLAVLLVAALGLGFVAAAAGGDGLTYDPGRDQDINKVNFLYQGKEYTLVFGNYLENTDSVGVASGSLWPMRYQDMIDHAGETQTTSFGGHPFVVTVFENLGHQGQAEVSDELRDAIIENVTFGKLEFDSDKPVVGRIETTLTPRKWSASYYLNYHESQAFFTANVTLNGCKNMSEEDLTSVELRHHVRPDYIPGDVMVDCAQMRIDTQEKLQSYLNDLGNVIGSKKVLGLYLMLSDADYGEISLANTENLNCDAIIFMGATEERNGVSFPLTKMSSLSVNSNKAVILNSIKFTKGTTQNNVGLSLTSDGSSRGEIGISNCSFTGYDQAIQISGGAVTRLECGNVLFQGNKVGLGCDFGGRNFHAEYAMFQMYNCAFYKCQTGTNLTGFGKDSIPYYCRIYHCDFINGNSGKKDIVTDASVYASGNYLDHASEKADKADFSLQYLSPSGLTNHLLYRFGYTNTVYPAPDWTASYIGVEKSANNVKLDKTDSLLYADGRLLLDGESFENRQTDLTMEVVAKEGSNSTTVGTWIFASESGEGE